MEAKVKFPTPGYLGNVKFPPLEDFVLLATCLSSQIPGPGAALNCQNPDPGESWLSQFPVGSLPPPTLGLNIDRCITYDSKKVYDIHNFIFGLLAVTGRKTSFVFVLQMQLFRVCSSKIKLSMTYVNFLFVQT